MWRTSIGVLSEVWVGGRRGAGLPHWIIRLDHTDFWEFKNPITARLFGNTKRLTFEHHSCGTVLCFRRFVCSRTSRNNGYWSYNLAPPSRFQARGYGATLVCEIVCFPTLTSTKKLNLATHFQTWVRKKNVRHIFLE